MVDEVGLRLGKLIVPGRDIQLFRLGGVHHLVIGLHLGADELIVQAQGGGVLGGVGLTALVGGVGAELRPAVGEAQAPGVGVGLRVGVVGAPVAEHQGVLTGLSHLGEEVGGGAGLQDDVDIIGAQGLLHLLFNNLALFIPVGGGGVVAHEDLYREGGPGGGELLHGLFLVVQGLGGIKAVGGVVGVGLQGGQVGVIHPVHSDEVLGGNGADKLAFGAVGLLNGLGLHPVQGVVEGLAEVLVVDGQEPVIRLIGGVKLGVEVKAEEVAVVAVALGGHHILQLGVVHPGGEDIGGDDGVVHLVPLVHGGSQGDGLLIEGLLNLVNKDVVLIPVGVVFHKGVGDLGLEVCDAESAAVQEVIGAVGGAELIPLLGDELRLGGHKADIGEHGEEVGGGGLEGVHQGVVVSGLDAQLVKIGELLGVKLVGVCDNAAHHIRGLGLVGGVHHPLEAGDKVVGGNRAVLGAVALHPLGVIAQVEGPGKAVLRGLPAGGQGGLDGAELVILHQGVNDVGGGLELQGGAGGQIVEGGHLRGIELAVDVGGAAGLGARILAGSRGAAAVVSVVVAAGRHA